MDIAKALSHQRQFFDRGATLSYEFRLEQLHKLREIISLHENDILNALKLDLNKPNAEATFSEILLVQEEITHAIKHLKKWMQPKHVKTPLPFWPGKSRIYFDPYGIVLIIAPWNYPFSLSLSPLVGAISAGNCAIVKPSEISSNTQNVIAELLTDHFSNEYITVVRGGAEETQQLLKEKFDYIFFTGGTQIGKIVMEAAAKHLTPLTLELGGKSPCIVDETANISYAARRIVWGKMSNAGQICIAPDYLYVQKSVKEKLIQEIKQVIKAFFGNDPKKSDSYARIVNQKHFARLTKLLESGKIIFGGKTDAEDRYFSPTLIENITPEDAIMQEEIFGPILPILTFENIDEVINTIKAKTRPLALYLFTNDSAIKQKFLQTVTFGGGCINDCLIQVANLNLPFGGVGASGMGSYHGYASFKTFSHEKSVYEKSLSLDFKFEYPPYTPRKFWWLRKLFKLS